ncbi:MAG: MFS transporter [Dehalococcoidia bacterium]
MSQATDPAQLRAAAANNIRRFYEFRFISHFQLWMPIWILYLHDSRGLSIAQILVLDALFEIMMMVAEVPTGVVADRWGRRRSMLLGQVGITLAVVMFAFAPSFWWVFACYGVWAVSGALTSGSDIAFVHDSLEAQGRSGEFHRVISRGNACQIAGMGVASMIGAPIAALTSLETTVALSIALAATAIPVVWRFRDPGTYTPSAEVRYFKLLGTAARRVAHNPRLRTLILLQALVNGLAWSSLLLTQVFLDQNGLPLAWFGVVLAGLHLVAMAAALLSPRVIGAVGRQRVIFMGAPAVALALVALGVMPLWGGIAMYATLRVVLNLLGPVLVDQINRESVDEVRATIASMGTMGISVVGAAAKPVMGWSADANGLGSAYVIAGVSLAALGSIALLAWARVSRSGPSPAPPEAIPEPV